PVVAGRGGPVGVVILSEGAAQPYPIRLSAAVGDDGRIRLACPVLFDGCDGRTRQATAARRLGVADAAAMRWPRAAAAAPRPDQRQSWTGPVRHQRPRRTS
ncbi:hypothetical protein, partial [Actinoallomurus acaciae]